MQISPENSHIEWLSLKAAMVTHPNLKATKSLEQLICLLITDHAGDYPNMVSIPEWELAICLATAECERDFSLLKLVKTSLRNCLSTKVLERLDNGNQAQSLDKYPFEKALEVWYGKARRTTTASLTPAEVRKLTMPARAAAVPATAQAAAPLAPGIMDQRQPMLQQMPVDLVMQLMQWQHQTGKQQHSIV